MDGLQPRSQVTVTRLSTEVADEETEHVGKCSCSSTSASPCRSRWRFPTLRVVEATGRGRGSGRRWKSTRQWHWCYKKYRRGGVGEVVGGGRERAQRGAGAAHGPGV